MPPRLWPNCYYRKTVTTYEVDAYVVAKTKTLSTSLARDIALMNDDIVRHDPFQRTWWDGYV